MAATHSNSSHPSLPRFSHYVCCYDTAQLIDGDDCSPSHFPGEIDHTPSSPFRPPSLYENGSSVSSSPASRWDRLEMHADLCEKAFGVEDWAAFVLLLLTARHGEADRSQATRWLTNWIRGPFFCSVFLFLERKRWFTNSEEVEVMAMTCLTHELCALSAPTPGQQVSRAALLMADLQMNHIDTSSHFSITNSNTKVHLFLGEKGASNNTLLQRRARLKNVLFFTGKQMSACHLTPHQQQRRVMHARCGHANAQSCRFSAIVLLWLWRIKYRWAQFPANTTHIFLSTK